MCALLCAMLLPAASADGLYGTPALYGTCAAGFPAFSAFTGYINGYRINMRCKPGTSSAVCGVVSCGDTIYVTNVSYCSGGRLWYYGTVGSLCGWVYSGYVAGAPIPAACKTPVVSCAVPSGYGTIVMNATNFRSGPGMYYASLMQLCRGTLVQLLCAMSDINGVVWYQVLTNGCTGWVRSDLVTTTGCASYGTAMPYTTSANFTGYTNTNAVNVRATPNGAKIAQVSRGTVVTVYGIVCQCGTYWYQVSFYGGMGYIRADLVTIGACPGGYGVGVGMNYYDYSNNSTSITITDGALSAGSGSYGYTDPNAYGAGYADPNAFGTGSIGYTDPNSFGTNSTGYTAPNAFGTGSTGYTAPGAFGTNSTGFTASAENYGMTGQNSYGFSDTADSMQNVPAAQANPAVPAWPSPLTFSTCSLTPGQTLPVYTAPNTASLRADNGTAQVTLSESLYAAGFDGQWLLVMYRNQNQMTRVGYVNAFQMQGTLPTLPSLTFSTGTGMVISRTALTSDPMEQTDALVMLNSGDSVTYLATLSLNGQWAYVETMANGSPVRGFIPQSAVR